MNPIKGENLMLWVVENDIFGNGSLALTPFALAQTCSLNVNTDSFDATSKDNGSWSAPKPGMKSWSVSSDNLYCPHADKLLLAQINSIEFPIYWLPAENTEADNQVTHAPALTVDGQTYMGYYGKAWINSYSANAANGEASNYTINMTGTGPLIPTNSLPNGGIGVSRPAVSIVKGGNAKTIVTFATGTLTATTSNAKVTATVANGVVTIAAAADCPVGAYIVTIADAGTSTTAYVFVTVAAS